MAAHVLPNPSNFLAVALIINRSRDGPGLVFHYPANVRSVRNHPRTLDGDYDYDAMFTDWLRNTGSDNDFDDYFAPEGLGDDEFGYDEFGAQVAPWDVFAGFPVKDLENLLTPGRSFHERVFQVSLGSLYCLSSPVHVPENGVWKRKKAKQHHANIHFGGRAQFYSRSNARRKVSKQQKQKKSSMTMFNFVFFLKPKKYEELQLSKVMYHHVITEINMTYKYSQEDWDFVWKESKKILLLKDQGAADRTNMSVLWEEILNESSLAASMREIYDAVSRNEIANLRLDMPQGPAVSHSIQIPIPFYVEDVPDDPDNPNEAATKGLWLTTAHSIAAEEALENPAYVAKIFTLLLMDEESKIISELESRRGRNPQSANKLLKFMRLNEPTSSFDQMRQKNVLSMGDVGEISRHFITWRRGIAVPPLHGKDVYVLSPNCDLGRLPKASEAWKRRFPHSKPLADFLADLSYAPQAYKTLCPAKLQRPMYLDMLAWLMRGGWVTQLCTFAYVVVWPEIIYEVDFAIEADEIKAQASNPPRWDSSSSESPSSDSTSVLSYSEDDDASSTAETAMLRHGTNGVPRSHLSTLSSSSTAPSGTFKPGGAGTGGYGRQAPPWTEFSMSSSPGLPKRTLEPTDSPSNTSASTRFQQSHHLGHHNRRHRHHHHRHRHSHANIPLTSQQLAEQARKERLADRRMRDAADRATAHARKVRPSATTHPSINAGPHLAGIEPYIISDPGKATERESMFLAAIKRRLAGELHVMAEVGGRGRGGGGGTQEDVATSLVGTTSSVFGAGPSSPVGAQAASVTAGPPGGPTGGGPIHGSDEPKKKLVEAWEKFERYFNGRHALERIALLEEMKRREVWTLLTKMSEYLLTVRHW